MGTIREGRKPTKWRDSDRLLQVALTLYEESVHHRCGQPRDVSMNPDSEGWFEVRDGVCQACAELDRHAAETQGKERAPGSVSWVVNALPAGVKLREAP